MAGRIPRVFINDLLARTDIVDLIDARVKLKSRARTTMRAVRSITKKPLFTVNGEKQFYHCFGCGAR
jgi:DNA primase